MKKLVSLTLVLAMMFSLGASALAADGVTVKNYTPEEISAYAQEYVDNKVPTEILCGHQRNVGEGYTVIREYLPSVTRKINDGFPLQEFTYDRTGQPESIVTVSYTNNTTISWAVSGGFDSTVSLFNLIKGKVNFDVARTSTVSSGSSSTAEYTLEGGKIYSITIYAHAIDTSGVFVREYYDFEDKLAQVERVPVSALLPLTSYTQTSGIHFGPALVIG